MVAGLRSLCFIYDDLHELPHHLRIRSLPTAHLAKALNLGADPQIVVL